ncbi:MAG: hypothetical protein ACQ9MH_16120 [Nitrospinales bacterium]
MKTDLKRELIELNEEVAKRLWVMWDMVQNKTDDSKLIFPKKRNQSPRVSEQESKIIFCQLLEKSPWHYSVETPTVQTYQQKGKGYQSGSTDISLYNTSSLNTKIVNIELKAHNPSKESFRKDFEKIIRDGLDGVWFHTIKSQNRGTMPAIFNKIIKAFEDLEHHFKETEKSILFTFCILDEPNKLIHLEVQFKGPADKYMEKIKTIFSQQTV